MGNKNNAAVKLSLGRLFIILVRAEKFQPLLLFYFN